MQGAVASVVDGVREINVRQEALPFLLIYVMQTNYFLFYT